MSGGTTLDIDADADADDVQDDIDEDVCLALTGDAEQCGNGTDTDASDPEEGLCGVHAGSDRAKVTDFDGPAWVGLRDELTKLFRSERDAYAFATVSPDPEDVWELVTALEDVTIGTVEFSTTRLCGLARDLADHPDLDVDDHPLGTGGCIALQGRSAQNYSCPNSSYGSSLLCGMHSDAELRGTVLDEGEDGPDLDTVTVAGEEFLLVEQRGADLIVVDLDDYELRRLEGAAGSETRWDDPETTPEISDDADRIVLVGCGDAKADERRPAKDLYTSNYFGLKRRYAEEHGDEWAILSAKYGLLDPEAEIDPYDLTIDDVDVGEWGVAVAGDLPDVQDTEAVVLAGPDYAEEVEGTLFMYGAEVEMPTEGMKIGERMNWLSEQLDEDDGEETVDVDHGGYPFACYDCADRYEEKPGDELCTDCGGPVVAVVPLYGVALQEGTTCKSMHCNKPAIWEIDQTASPDAPFCAGHAAGYRKSQMRMIIDVERPDVPVDPDELADRPPLLEDVDEDDRVKVSLEDGRSYNGTVSDIGTGFWDTEPDEVDLSIYIDVDASVGMFRDDLLSIETNRDAEGNWSEIVAYDCAIGSEWDETRKRIGLVDDVQEAEPEPPESLPKYLREGLQKQNAGDLRSIAAYADELADHLESEAQQELKEKSDQDVDETPEEWDGDEWEEQLDEAMEKGEVPESKGTMTTKEIDGRRYFYLQWREGDSVKSQYVAPVTPSADG